MVMTRWDPFNGMSSLRDAFSRLLEDAVVPGDGGTGDSKSSMDFVPAVDVQESDDAYTVKMSLPGVKPEQVNIQVQQDTLTISGEMREEQERDQGRYRVRERRSGRFARTMAFPSGIDADRADASFHDGILEIRLPKRESAKPKQIQVQPGQTESSEAKQGQGNGASRQGERAESENNRQAAGARSGGS